MSRKYVNDKWCVRCGKEDPTPYLSKKLDVISPDVERRENMVVIDIGCGNGRNTNYMKEQGFGHIYSYDMAGDFGEEMTIGRDSFPLGMSAVDIVLANYIMMFLDTWESSHTMNEIDRVTKPGGYVMFELYAAKDSYYPTKEKLLDLQQQLREYLEGKGWEVVHYVQEKFIMRKS